MSKHLFKLFKHKLFSKCFSETSHDWCSRHWMDSGGLFYTNAYREHGIDPDFISKVCCDLHFGYELHKFCCLLLLRATKKATKQESHQVVSSNGGIDCHISLERILGSNDRNYRWIDHPVLFPKRFFWLRLPRSNVEKKISAKTKTFNERRVR